MPATHMVYQKYKKCLVVYNGRKETKKQNYNNTYSELHTTYASDTSYQKGQQRRLFRCSGIAQIAS